MRIELCVINSMSYYSAALHFDRIYFMYHQSNMYCCLRIKGYYPNALEKNVIIKNY